MLSSENSDIKAFQDFERVTACPVCGAAQFKTAFEPDVAQCSRCCVYFRNPRPTQQAIQRSYDFGANYAQWQQSPNRRAMWERRMALITPFKSGGSLLDVGAGDGFFLDIAKEHRFETFGTELSKTGASYALQRGHQLLIGQLMDIDFSGRTFDAITMWHVLEHVPDPGAVIDRVFNLLKPGGVFAVAVPNEENHLFRHRIGLSRETNPLMPLVWGAEIHLTHFQPATLRAALCEHGFEILRFGVDDIYSERSPRNLAKLFAQNSLSALFGWHFSMAMYCICRRRLG